MKGLPTSWSEVALGDHCEITLGQSPPGSSYNEIGDGVPFFQGKAEFGRRHPSVRKWTTAGTKFAKAGDILISVRAPVGPTNVADVDCAIGRGLASIRAPSDIAREYVLLALEATNGALVAKATGSTFEAVSGQVLRSHRIPLAPPDEQARIVERTQDLLSRLERASADLEDARARMGILVQAAIRDEIDRMPDRVGIAQATNGDRRAMAIGPFGSNLKVSDYRDSGVPLVFVRNIRARQFDGPDTKYVTSDKALELEAHKVRAGDVLVTKMGDPPGDVAVYSGDREAVITADCIKVSPAKEILSRYLAYALRAPVAQEQILRVTTGVAQRKVSLARFKAAVTVPVPDAEVQDRIVGKLDAVENHSERLTNEIAQALAAAQQLRSSILAAAFSGRLTSREACLV